MSVHAYLHFAARLRGMSKAEAERRVPEVEEQTQLRDVAMDPIASLSHGFKQRVGIAQAVVHRPRLLVLDEPITGLDPVQIVEMRELLRSLRGEHTIILSSHILSEISETCDRLLVIKGGEIAAAGTEAELSAKLLRGAEVELTLRYEEGQAAAYRASSAEGGPARPLLEKLEGVRKVELLPQAEPGERVVSLRIEAEHDVREAACKALIEAGIGILQVRAGERELESVFLSLAGSSSREAKKTAAARAATGKAKAAQKSAKDEDEKEDA